MTFPLSPLSRSACGGFFAEDLALPGFYILAAARPLAEAPGFVAEVIVWDIDAQTVAHRDDGHTSGRRWLDGEAALQFAMRRGHEMAARIGRAEA